MNKTVYNKDDVFNKIADLISKAADLPVEKVTPESTFISMGLDSLDALAFISDLEEEYKIKIPNTELLKIKTVGQAVDSLYNKIAEG